MSTTIMVPVICDQHDVTSIPAEIAPGVWAVIALHCWDCDVTYECEKE